MIPGMSVSDIINQYKDLEDDVSDIEAGLFPTPGYLTSSFTLDLGDDHDYDALRKKSSSRSKSVDHEKKIGVPWTDRKFLMGLLKHGKGDWRSISRNFIVVTKLPTQVASHAQKYFLRLNSGLKDKRRPSIHDITTTNLTNAPIADDSRVAAFDQFVMVLPQEKEISQKVVLEWDQYQDPLFMGFESDYRNLFLAPTPCNYLYAGPHTPMLEVQSATQRIRG